MVPSFDESFFLFGPRGTGKTTLLESIFKDAHLKIEWINLLDTDRFEEFLVRPALLRERIEASRPDWVIIDEIQKIPSLLDIVHQCIEKFKTVKFALTGSSARKLKRDGANLLAGRAFDYRLHPLTFRELHESHITTDDLLSWGSLPKIFSYRSSSLKKKYLRTYAQTYLREEIQLEQITRNLFGFRSFLEVAAGSNGQIVNFSKLGEVASIDEKTMSRYYQILIDTFLGFFLEPYSRSVRKRQAGKPKFYFFDTGIVRTLSKQLDIPLTPSTYSYGNLFEQLVFLEIRRFTDYWEKDFTLSYLRTQNNVEVDLIVERPGQRTILIEIKSASKILESHCKNLRAFAGDFPDADLMVLCQERKARVLMLGKRKIHIYPWQNGVLKIFEC